jgi:hypothetical protein
MARSDRSRRERGTFFAPMPLSLSRWRLMVSTSDGSRYACSRLRSKERTAPRVSVPQTSSFVRYRTERIPRLFGGNETLVKAASEPADIPVQQTEKIEFAMNLRSARALGNAVPPFLLALADDVIE